MADDGTKQIASASDLRRICRYSRSAVLATSAVGHKQVDDGWPVASMVVPAIDVDGTPILLISDLADHTRHLKTDDRLSLLFTGSRATDDHSIAIETDNPRLTLFGRAVQDGAETTRARYLLANPDAAQYADFGDFGFYRIAVEAAYWVGGFGKQRRLSGAQFIVDDCPALVTGHDRIVDHMNADHLVALADIVGHYTDHPKNLGWKMVAIDCDGMDLATEHPESSNIRIEFPTTIRNPGDAREILVEMCKKSRDFKA